MNILALDTSMGACSAALLRADGTQQAIFARQVPMARGHAEALLPMVAEIMDEAGVEFAAVDRIAATLGPGSFTGVRIAIAAARGIALVTDAKLWGTDSLTVMAWVTLAESSAEGPFAVAVDARRSMLYLGLFDGEGKRLQGPVLVAPDAAIALLPEGCNKVFGSGAAFLAEAALASGLRLEASLPDLQPSAANLAELALKADETLPSLRPLYLRAPDAKPQAPSAVARR
jgi:tRNA threonylcarbamoyladenosine biosynthesis protein TsaB